MNTKLLLHALLVFGLFSLTTPKIHADTTIYADAFPGSSANPLNGTTPATESGTFGGSSSATWSANSVFKADGSVAAVGSGSAASAVLPFTPQTNQLYTLTATVNTTAGINGDWIALGFAQSNNTSLAFNNTTNGYAWMLERSTRGAGQGQTFLGPNVTGGATFTDPVGALVLGIVLNTGMPNWTVQFFLNGNALGAPTSYAINPTINFVGFSMLGTATGTLQNFSLTAVPESGATLWMLLASLGLLGCVQIRRRKA